MNARQLAVLARIHDLVEQQSQFLIATHSPILMAYPHACIYQCNDKGIKAVAYDETEHVKVTRDFLADPKRMLQHLLAKE
jgi:predicted ATPase